MLAATWCVPEVEGWLPCLPARVSVCVQGLVHITGGGFPENIPRVVPKGLATRINRSAWDIPPLFKWLQEVGQGGPGADA